MIVMPCKTTRRGLTLIELIISIAISAILMVGLSSAMFIALRASNTSSGPGDGALNANSVVVDMIAEIQYAQSITEQTATAINVTVPDQNSDTFPETIRYAWSGIPGDPLTRQYNSGTVANVVVDVNDFALEYVPSASPIDYVNVTLQVGSDGRSRVDSAIRLLNRP